MKRDLALQLLQVVLPDLTDEGAAANLFRELQFLADYKYNKYEMYYPGRLFLENLYLWLQQFEESERSTAIEFVRKELIFISRQEFQQLAGVLYHDGIRRRQLETAAKMGGYPPHKVRAIRESLEFKRIGRASLYVGLSDGARIDYIRRHNLEISNEQVLPYYETSPDKGMNLLRDLRSELADPQAAFHCLFLLDDFCGSGRTLLREVVVSELGTGCEPPVVPPLWSSKFRLNRETTELELLYEGELSTLDQEALLQMGSGDKYVSAVGALIAKSNAHDTVLKGALCKVAVGNLVDILDPNATIFLCPLLATEHALSRLQPLISRLPGPFAQSRIIAGAVMDSRVAITSAVTPMGALCEKYYSDTFGDHHTGSVKFGFDNCGLPVVLHHNTPNNSIYLLWNRRKEDFSPLFIRYERHGREGA
jgi:hypothetical protein